MKKIILIGYMGCGKSIISKKIAKTSKLKHFDLDNLIEEKENRTISTIFTEKGELYFRKLEHQVFADLMKSEDSFVLSIGGGTPCYFNNHEFLNLENCISIYLKATVETLFDRLSKEKNDRPLIKTLKNDDLKEFIAKHLFERNFYYNQAKYKINVDNKSVEEITKEICDTILV